MGLSPGREKKNCKGIKKMYTVIAAPVSRIEHFSSHLEWIRRKNERQGNPLETTGKQYYYVMNDVCRS